MLRGSILAVLVCAVACTRAGSASKADKVDESLDRGAPSGEPTVQSQATPSVPPALQKQRPAKLHRAASASCSRTRGPGKTGWGPKGDCKSDAECKDGQNGRCSQFGLGAACTYDACFADSDCKAKGAGSVCACRTDTIGPNRCAAGNCQIDADCNGWSCSPTLGDMGHIGGIVAYYCHGPQDACIDDEDCSGGASCRYAPTLGHFACSKSEVRPG